MESCSSGVSCTLIAAEGVGRQYGERGDETGARLTFHMTLLFCEIVVTFVLVGVPRFYDLDLPASMGAAAPK